MNLDCLFCDIGGRLRGEHLAHRRLHGVVFLGIFQAGGFIGHQLAGLYFRPHVGQFELDRLEVADRCSKLLPLFGVGQRPLKGTLGNSQRLGGDTDTTTVQGVHGDLEPLSFLAQQVFCRNPDVVQGKGGGIAAADSQFFFVFEDLHTRGLEVNDKGRHSLVLEALVVGGKKDAGSPIAAVGNKDLGAVDDEFISFAPVGSGDSTGVASGIRFGKEEAADDIATVQGREPFFLLFRGAEGIDRAAGKGGVSGDKNAAGTACL